MMSMVEREVVAEIQRDYLTYIDTLEPASAFLATQGLVIDQKAAWFRNRLRRAKMTEEEFDKWFAVKTTREGDGDLTP